MKAMRLCGGGDLRAETVPDPTPAPEEVVVKVHACSICGSDLHAFHGKHPRLVFPRILGHEFAGEIVALGSAVPHSALGYLTPMQFHQQSRNMAAQLTV